jgi:hypothetical protein
MQHSAADIAARFAQSLAHASRFDEPFVHFFAAEILPPAVVGVLADLQIAPPDLEALSGKREYHNGARVFFNDATARLFPIFDPVAIALQSATAIDAIEALCATNLGGTFLRIEYAVDSDGFWLEPHTDLGVKKFTCLISLAKDENESHLGTDIYRPDKRLYRRIPFLRNAGLIFIPSPQTWHGFAPRPIARHRRSLILNYVASEWRDRDQLAFPDTPIRCP